MPTIVVKPARDRDLYVGWSSIVDAPTWWGTRDEALSLDEVTEERLARADDKGSSDLSIREGWWDDSGFVYDQRGWLPREHLLALVEALTADKNADVSHLLDPFDDVED